MVQTVTDNPAARRCAQQPLNTLTAEAFQWLNELPAEVRPRELPMVFARIANALHAAWSRPQWCLAYFNELVIDGRCSRQGFPSAVALEIAALKDFYETNIHVTKQTVWDHIRAAALNSPG